MTQAFELPDSPADKDKPPNLRVATNDSAPLRCKMPGCTNGVTKPARGRTPDYCDEHKNKNARQNNRSATSGKVWSRATEVESVLNNYVQGAATLMAFGNKEDAKVIQQNGPRLVHELVELAKTDDHLRKPLEWAVTPGKYGPLIMALMAVVIPIMGNHNLLPKIDLSSKGGVANGA